MKRFTAWGLRGLMLVLLIFMAAGCDTIEDIFENDKEVSGTIEVIDGNALTVDGIVYVVTDKTEYEGISGLADLNVGDEVEIEYKDNGDGTREAVEVELAGAEDDD